MEHFYFYKNENLNKIIKYMSESDMLNFYASLFKYIQKLKDSYEKLINYINENFQYLKFETIDERTFIEEFNSENGFLKKYNILKTIRDLIVNFINDEAIFNFHYFKEIENLKKNKNIDSDEINELSDDRAKIRAKITPISGSFLLTINEYFNNFDDLNKLRGQSVNFHVPEYICGGLSIKVKDIKQDLDLYKKDIDGLYSFVKYAIPIQHVFTNVSDDKLKNI